MMRQIYFPGYFRNKKNALVQMLADSAILDCDDKCTIEEYVQKEGIRMKEDRKWVSCVFALANVVQVNTDLCVFTL